MDDRANDDEAMEMGFIGSLEPQVGDVVAELMLSQLGGSKRRVKDARRGYKHLVSEIYSPPRVTAEIRKSRTRHLLPGFALDLTVLDPSDGLPWDFNLEAKREKARRMVREQRPYLLIGSPECRAFSTWQALNESRAADPERLRREKIKAQIHIDFVASLYREQLEGDRFFLHEHPRWATSWRITSISELLEVPGVELVHTDQCQFGAEARRGGRKGSPVKKPTGFLTNSPALARTLARRCEGQRGSCTRPKGGSHVICEGVVARDAAVYPRELCRAVLRGITAQLREDRRLQPGCYGLQALNDDEEAVRSALGPEQGFSGKYRDDLTGQVLKDTLVQEARRKELEYFLKKGVWRKVPRHRARQLSGRLPISVRWVDVNKGDEIHPNYRSRLVARQIKALDKSGATYFAHAPPLEALRTVLSMAMTEVGDHKPDWRPNSPTRTQVSFVDVSRAYFNAKVDKDAPPCFVELPPEDSDRDTLCGELLRHMYGTRMAADGWQEEYSMLLIRLGFEQGKACPNVFFHRSRDISCSVHGDDFTSSGPADALDWLEAEVGREYEITVGPRLGPGPHDAKEARALNRVVRWLDDRIEYEADPRQAERLMAECGLDGCKSMTTPGVQPTFRELEEDQELQQKLHTAFRGASARGNYLSADRVDCQFACKEICRWMAKPTEHSWKALKRLCRYLAGLPRLVYVHRKQKVDCVDIYTDTNWAGCPKTRKSTSGGAVLLGRHTIKHWSSTQTSVALSSGEAEFNGVVRGAGQGLGYQALLSDLGVDVPLRVWTDSSAAIGICSRQGLGKLRHIDAHMLWIQQAVRSGRVDLRKIDGEKNPADLLTKHSLSRDKLWQLTQLYDCHFLEGRAQSAPQVRSGASGRVTMAEADATLSAVEPDSQQGEGCEEGIESWMPHNTLSREQLDEQFPPLQAPEAEEPEGLEQDAGDDVYRHGMTIAASIVSDMNQYGRIRSKRKMQELMEGHENRKEGPGEHPLQGIPVENTQREVLSCISRSDEKNEPNHCACGALHRRGHTAHGPSGAGVRVCAGVVRSHQRMATLWPGSAPLSASRGVGSTLPGLQYGGAPGAPGSPGPVQ